MIWHVLGWLVLISQLVLGSGTAWYLCANHRVAVSWERRLPVPRVIEDFAFSSGSDFVGYV